ncbi:site-specific DNA-methyltransferase [Lysinibacillus sp. NPDC097287]|uniref:site-specific DNA-methyltransferase n=1 Tax=Lysinibacillus sp. NPDC097287 TaxID=3364144 RepID=UPI00381B7527
MVNKMNGESLNITAQNIAHLKEIFPEILTDGEKIDFDMLKTVLGEVVETEKERYQFTWNGKKKMIEGAQKPSKGTLRPVPEKSKNFDTTENLYIEGDNLEVLKLLQKSYNGKIKMIYIDPPYNTGKDFVYKDNFKDGVQNYLEQTGQVDDKGNVLSTNTESNGRFHTDWLNMMYPRLKLARNLLSDKGMIFISIDENEQERLKFICNEIFGENNFITTICNLNNPKGRSDDKYIATAHEYIMIYCKNKEKVELYGFEPTEVITTRYNKVEVNTNRKYREIDLRKTGENDLREDRPNLFYYFYYNQETKEIYPSREEDTPEGFIKIKPVRADGREGNWRWGLNTAIEKINKLVPKYMPNKQIWGIMEKDYLDERDLVKSTTIWNYKDVNSERGTEQFINLDFDKNFFQKPKPIGTIERCMRLGLRSEDIILDFFSGSATTAHALMKLNSEDGIKRKFILVQLPEVIDGKSHIHNEDFHTICDIGEERIRRAGEKIKADLIEQQQQAGMLDENIVDPNSLDIGFKVLKLDTSNIREWNVDFVNLEAELDLYETPFIDGRSEEDIVYEIMLKQGLELTYPIETFEVNGQTVYDIAFGSLFVCLSQKITADIAKAIIARRDEHGTDTSSVIFSDAGFDNDSDKLNYIEILKDAGYPDDNLLTL